VLITAQYVEFFAPGALALVFGRLGADKLNFEIGQVV